MQLRCHNVLVTGGGSGIGKAIAKRLLVDGANVVIVGRNMDKLIAARDEIASDRLFCMRWDITDFEQCKERFREAEALMGGFDGLVNCAGAGTNQVTGRGFEPWDITMEEWDKLVNIDLKASLFLLRNAVDDMKARGVNGNILNIASNAAFMDIIGPYGASKLSLIRMTRAFGKRFGKDGIIINGIAPGATFTPMISYYANDINQPYPRHAIGRYIHAEEIAELAAYLMSIWGEIICGHTVVADGGDIAAM